MVCTVPKNASCSVCVRACEKRVVYVAKKKELEKECKKQRNKKSRVHV